MFRRLVPLVLIAVATAGAITPADAKPKPPPIKGDAEYSDPTPDPSGNAESGNEKHCNGLLPREAPYVFKAPAAGKLVVKIDGYVGDWSLQIRDGKDKILGGDDQNPPATESATVKVKAKGEIRIQPCNLGGTPMGAIHYTFTYA